MEAASLETTTRTAARSERGGRPRNEDSCAYAVSGDRGAWIVADGLGGMAGGDLASGFAAEYIKTRAAELADFGEASLLRLLAEANRALACEQRRRKMERGMRTTVVAAFAEGGVFSAVHLGDSRLYYFRGGEILHQSRDHSMSQAAVDLGEIAPQDIRFHEDRSRVLRVLGNDGDPRVDTPLFTEGIKPGDAFLLCSDGFWEPVFEHEMAACLKRAGDPQGWLDAMLCILRGRQTDSSDNYTAVCCMAGGGQA
jgi:serine/threonine protein phosphatase PrpC